MDIVLTRRGGVPVRDQLVIQLELRILSGHLAPGQKLPSVRALARRLRLHPNTVSAAFQELEASGHVEMRRGSGVYVRSAAPDRLDEARSLDDMIRMALHTALKRGFSGPEIRAAVERWLAAAPPDRVVVVDPVPEMGELLVHELRESLSVRCEATTLDAAQRERTLLAGALALCLPYHLEALHRLAAPTPVETVTLEVSEADRRAVLALPSGAVVLVVSHAPGVVAFAIPLLHSLRGDEIHVEGRRLAERAAWRRLAAAADLVVADALAAPELARTAPRQLRVLRLVAPPVLERLRVALGVAAAAPAAARQASGRRGRAAVPAPQSAPAPRSRTAPSPARPE
jgi:GntR family transcriptional regulator